jgi:hypothetical protein
MIKNNNYQQFKNLIKNTIILIINNKFSNYKITIIIII